MALDEIAISTRNLKKKLLLVTPRLLTQPHHRLSLSVDCFFSSCFLSQYFQTTFRALRRHGTVVYKKDFKESTGECLDTLSRERRKVRT
jgi:hypothetical protein